MRDHIRILGILNIIVGSLTAAVGVVALLAAGTLASVIGASIASATGSDLRDAATAAPIIGMIGMLIAAFFILLGLPAIIGGWGLLHFRPWSRILMIIVSAFHLFHVPLGTALGIYGLWVLLNTGTQRILESGGAYLGPPVPTYPPPAGA